MPDRELAMHGQLDTELSNTDLVTRLLTLS